MKTYIRNSIIMTSLLLPIICSCTEIKEETNTEVVECKIDSLSFKKDILPIFESNCFSCHNEEKYASKADGNLMQSYQDIKKLLDEGLIIGNIERRAGFIGMPYKKEKIDSCDIEKIKAWVKLGAINN